MGTYEMDKYKKGLDHTIMKPKIVVATNLKFYKDQIKRLDSLGNVIYYSSV